MARYALESDYKCVKLSEEKNTSKAVWDVNLQIFVQVDFIVIFTAYFGNRKSYKFITSNKFLYLKYPCLYAGSGRN